jgi:hypothetical protein
MAGDDQSEPIDSNLRRAVLQAIRLAQSSIKWKPGKGETHLSKRIRLGHLPIQTTLSDYEAIITAILNHGEAKVFVFFFEGASYPSIVTTLQDKVWLTMIGLDGLMETAFPPDEPETYLQDPAFVYVGVLEEFQNE